mgnify:CR=1 FL=1
MSESERKLAAAKAFAAALVALLDRTVIEIDVDALAVTY